MPGSHSTGRPKRLSLPIVLIIALALVAAAVVGLALAKSSALTPSQAQRNPGKATATAASSASASTAATATSASSRSISAPPAGSIVAFIGDSYVQAAGAEHPRWTTMLCSDRQWQEQNVGLGGTTYNVFNEQIPEAAKANPDAVIVSGGRNDGELRADDIREFYKQLRAALPNAKLYGVEPLGDYQPRPDWLVQKGSVVKQAVESVGGMYLEVGEPLYQHPEWVQDDHVHPNEEGHRAIADAVNKALGS